MKLLIFVTYFLSAIAIISSASLLISTRAGTSIYTPDPLVVEEKACQDSGGTWQCILDPATQELTCSCTR